MWALGFFVLFVFGLFLFPLFLQVVAAQMHLGRSNWNSIRTPNLQCKQDTTNVPGQAVSWRRW